MFRFILSALLLTVFLIIPTSHAQEVNSKIFFFQCKYAEKHQLADGLNCYDAWVEYDESSCDGGLSIQSTKPRSCYAPDSSLKSAGKYENFKVRVYFEPSPPFSVVLEREYADIGIDSSATIHGYGFDAVREGSKLCVYTSFPQQPVIVHYSTDSHGREIDRYFKDNDNKNPTNCIPLPMPSSNYTPPKWGGLIATACTNFKSTASKLGKDKNWAEKEKKLRYIKPFTSIVVQCLELTMFNIFYADVAGGESFFTLVQKRLSGIIGGLLVLYVIFMGYKIMMGKQVPQKPELFWFVLKFALVLYFTLGTGIQDWWPSLINSSKELSNIMLDATSGSANVQNYVTATVSHTDDGKPVISEVETESGNINSFIQTVLGSSNSQDLWDVNYKEGETLSASKVAYAVCDIPDGDTYTLPDTEADLADVGYDPRGVRVWDLIDCRFATYLGIGYKDSSPYAPVVLLIFMAAIFSTPYSILVFLFGLVFLIFLIIIMLRTIQIYLIAFMAVVLLGYVAPLIIPAVLFEKTKNIFESWLKQVISYLLQPVILFAFLGVFFASLDTIIYGGNKVFDGNNTVLTTLPPEGAEDSDFTPSGKCIDSAALGCIYKTIQWQKTEDMGLGDDFTFSFFKIPSDPLGTNLFLGLLKLVLVCFVISLVVDTVESMSTKLTGGAASAASMAAVPSASKMGPGEISKNVMKAAAIIAGKSGDMAKSAGKVGRKGISKKGGGGKGGGGKGGGGKGNLGKATGKAGMDQKQNMKDMKKNAENAARVGAEITKKAIGDEAP